MRSTSAARAKAPAFFSSPGRTEIVGNHTDHNNGLVLAAAVTLDTLAAAAPTGTGIITLYSQGYDKPFVVDTRDLEKKEAEKNTTDALIRGVCRKLHDMATPSADSTPRSPRACSPGPALLLRGL